MDNQGHQLSNLKKDSCLIYWHLTISFHAGHQGVRLRVHNSSVLFRSRPPCVVFASVQQTDDGWFEMQGVTAVLPEWLTEVAPHMYHRR